MRNHELIRYGYYPYVFSLEVESNGRWCENLYPLVKLAGELIVEDILSSLPGPSSDSGPKPL
ncbi:hypothetical protein AYI68_g4289, partial [Smittium mucronatum]